MVPFGRLPPDCATVDFFDVGDCAPGAVDHHDFERPVYVDGTIIFLNLVHHNKNQTPNALTPNTLTPNTHHPTPHTPTPHSYTVSMLSSQAICMGQTIKTPTAGDFVADFRMVLPRRSILVREKHSAGEWPGLSGVAWRGLACGGTWPGLAGAWQKGSILRNRSLGLSSGL